MIHSEWVCSAFSKTNGRCELAFEFLVDLSLLRSSQRHTLQLFSVSIPTPTRLRFALYTTTRQQRTRQREDTRHSTLKLRCSHSLDDTHARTQTPLPARCDRALHTDQTDTNTLRAGSWLPLRRCCSSARLRCRPCLSIAILYSDSHCSFLTANQGASEADLCAITARHYLPGNRHSLIRARTSPSLSRRPPEHNRVHPRINRNRD